MHQLSCGRPGPRASRDMGLNDASADSLLARDRFTDPQTGVAPGVTRGRNVRSKCRCSMCPAIHITSRSWLRSSSTHEPRDPPLGVVFLSTFLGNETLHTLYGIQLFGQLGFPSLEKRGRGPKAC